MSSVVAVLVMTFGMLAATLTFPSMATAQSYRCPSDQIDPGKDTEPGETSKIEALWRDLHGVGKAGGDGPLGCPIATPQTVNGPGAWKGVAQKFQRGWILLGRGPWIASEIAAIRGLGSWTIWSKGLPTHILPTVSGVKTGDSTAAAWSRGGTVFVTPSTDIVTMLLCPAERTYSSGNQDCTNLLPALDAPDRPFDAAAHLREDPKVDPKAHLLTTPDVKGFDDRVNAMFADWLPCYTPTPKADEVGEDAFAHAMIMMRRDAPCPITGRSPSGDVKQWLLTLGFPGNMLPGTSITGQFPCTSRKGELDVTLVQLLRLTLNHRAAVNGPVLDHIKSLLDPWGVGARKIPYVTPNGDCVGFLYIETENHMLLQETAAYLINSLMGRDTSSNRNWIVKFLIQISRRDFYEFNSMPYSRYHLKALYLLHDHAPDEQVKIVAKGLLDWIFAKEAVSRNLDRDHRPYRRTYSDTHLVPRDWWGSAATPVTIAAALFAGPLQHVHSDIDLQFDNGLDEQFKPVLMDVTQYPKLGTAPGYTAEALVDAASTGYRFPEALTGWLERRFTGEESNRITYLQAINHTPKYSENSAIFAQANNGAELVSGNRNWTMIGGGAPAAPGDPGDPPLAGIAENIFTAGGVVVGAIVGAYVGSTFGPVGTAAGAIIGGIIGGFGANQTPKQIAVDQQHELLWSTQAGTIRETTLISTPVGLDRSQTMRFGRSIVTTEDPQIARLCVAEGFMCGFDLRMPIRPFPAKDALNCVYNDVIPDALKSAFQLRVGGGQTITSVLGCQQKPLGFQEGGKWTVWTFENGMLAIGLSDKAGDERFAGAWIEGRTATDRGRLRVAWNIRGDGYDWFRVHAYKKSVSSTGGEPPGGWIEPLPVVGDAGDRTKNADGDTSIPIPNFTDPDLAEPSWDLLIVGCVKKYFLGVLRGHDCVDDRMPRLTVNVGPLPKQSFSCEVHRPPLNPGFDQPPHEGIVMEVGSCKEGPYGLFVYVWSKACPASKIAAINGGTVCPEGAIDYGFVVVAPSRGLKPEEFRNIVELSIKNLRSSGKDLIPGGVASIDVPISPPVLRSGAKWTPSAPASKHSVTFRWPVVGGAAILGDSGAPGVFDPAVLGGAPNTWPTALGHVSAPDSVGASDTLLRNSGSGCFTLAGFPAPSDPNPRGLLVDFRNPAAPIVEERRTSDLATLCP